MLLAEADKYPFPSRVLVRELDLEKEPGLLPSLFATYGRLLKSARSGAQIEDLRSLILEKMGRSSVPMPTVRSARWPWWTPAHHEQFARALANHPTEADLPILVAALASHDPNTTNLVTGALLKIQAKPQGPEGLAHLIRLARRAGPSSRPVLDELAARWTGSPKPADSASFENVLKAWEDVYRRTFPTAPPLAGLRRPELTLTTWASSSTMCCGAR